MTLYTIVFIIIAMSQTITFTNDVGRAIDRAIARLKPNKTFVLVDTTTRLLVLPTINSETLRHATIIEIPQGEDGKCIATIIEVWQQLQNEGATRHSSLINLGGGVVTDLGGFAAATFKRGFAFINVPTTLLSAVDAAVGGKTGINFGRLKNEVGAFAMADEVIISTCFFNTLPATQLRSGYAEMLKHALLKSPEETQRLLEFDIEQVDLNALLPLLETSVKVKEEIVAQDPHELGLRRALNLGHTAGHAFESLALQRGKPTPHGYAVAWGLVVELVLSHMALQFDSVLLHRIAEHVRNTYGTMLIDCDDYPALLNLMHHDKKSRHGEIDCTLLRAPGDITTGNTVADADMTAALDIYRDLLGI